MTMGKRKEKIPPALAKMRDWFDQKFVQGIENPVVKEPPPPPPPPTKPVRERKSKSESVEKKPPAFTSKPEIPVAKITWTCPKCKNKKGRERIMPFESTVTEATLALYCFICSKFIDMEKVAILEGRPSWKLRSPSW